jgi:peptidoglycan/LPS O-acetylase OafA/YrhL
MALSYKTRRRLSLLVLVVGLPVYIGLAWYILSLFDRPRSCWTDRLRRSASPGR